MIRRRKIVMCVLKDGYVFRFIPPYSTSSSPPYVTRLSAYPETVYPSLRPLHLLSRHLFISSLVYLYVLFQERSHAHTYTRNITRTHLHTHTKTYNKLLGPGYRADTKKEGGQKATPEF